MHKELIGGMKMKYTIVSVACVVLMFSLCVGYATAVDENEQKSASIDIMYLYQTRAGDASEWVKYLNKKGYSAHTAKADTADSLTNLTSMELIIIGNDTAAVWSTWDDMIAIKHSHTNVLGIGNGGISYFGAAGLQMRSGFTMGSTDDSMKAVNKTNSIWTTPNTIPLSLVGEVKVHSAVTYERMISLSSVGGNVTTFAYDPDYPAYSTLCWEGLKFDRKTYWAFYTNSPDDLTVDGRNLLQNAIEFTKDKVLIFEIPYTAILVAGCAGLLATIAVCIIKRRLD